MNGPIEHAGQAIATIAQSFIVNTKLPKMLWPEAFKAVTYILNWTPTHTPNPDKPGEYEWIIPIQHFQELTKGYIERPNLSNL